MPRLETGVLLASLFFGVTGQKAAFPQFPSIFSFYPVQKDVLLLSKQRMASQSSSVNVR